MPDVNTLIELYDERPMENVLGVEVFRPQRVVYVCPDSVASDAGLRTKLRGYFAHRGLAPELVFLRASVYDAGTVHTVLRRAAERYPDCVVDITGGTDAVLFAAGRLSAERQLPVVTYSRKKNRFFNIQNAPFVSERPVDLRYRVEDFLRMAGGSMQQGRVDNRVLESYLSIVDPFFGVFMKYRRRWDRIVTYVQRISPPGPDGEPDVHAHGAYEVKGERGTRVLCPEEALRDLEQIGLLRDLTIVPEQDVSFRFRDLQIRSWLRDVGSVLELFVWKACRDVNVFDDLHLSVVVDWEGIGRGGDVTNELDVVATCGLVPIFISCKSGEVKTEALNELAVLRDRFGGQMARAAVVTSELGGPVMRSRAGELGIDVIDRSELDPARLHLRLKSLAGARER